MSCERERIGTIDVARGLCLALGTLRERWLPFTLGKPGGPDLGRLAQNRQK